jgi:hypothetical protein
MARREVKAMKLHLLFIVMELLILLAYPIVFVYGKLRQDSRSKESNPLENILAIGSVTPNR